MIASQDWKPSLLRKDKEVAALLEAVLWGKEVALAHRAVHGPWRPLER